MYFILLILILQRSCPEMRMHPGSPSPTQYMSHPLLPSVQNSHMHLCPSEQNGVMPHPHPQNGTVPHPQFSPQNNTMEMDHQAGSTVYPTTNGHDVIVSF